MKKFVLNVGFLGLLILLTSSISPANAAVDTTKVGVNNGDEFVFVVDEYTSLFGEGFNPGFFGDPSVAVGSEFTMTILDATPTLDFWGDMIIAVNFDNGTSNGDYDIALPEGAGEDEPDLGFILYTDWVFWETEAKIALEVDKAAGEVDSFSIENGATEFIMKTSISETDEEGTAKGDSTIIYEKSTGVLLYQYVNVEFSSPAFSLRIQEEIRRKGFTAPGSGSADGLLPGFDAFLTFSTLSLMILIVRKTK